jgi:hypothetical protein
MNRVEFNVTDAELRGGIKALTNALVENTRKLAREPPNWTHQPNQAEICPTRSHLDPESRHAFVCRLLNK